MPTVTATELVAFATGTRYSCTSACDSDITWTFEVISRTAKFVTLRDVHTGDVRRVGVRVFNFGGSARETCSPLGTYSMAPVLDADRPSA